MHGHMEIWMDRGRKNEGPFLGVQGGEVTHCLSRSGEGRQVGSSRRWVNSQMLLSDPALLLLPICTQALSKEGYN